MKSQFTFEAPATQRLTEQQHRALLGSETLGLREVRAELKRENARLKRELQAQKIVSPEPTKYTEAQRMVIAWAQSDGRIEERLADLERAITKLIKLH